MSKQQGEFREVVFELGKENRRALRRILASLGAAVLLVSTLLPSIKILTPTNNSCAIFTAAMESGDPKVVALAI
jgi:hypothetical protein